MNCTPSFAFRDVVEYCGRKDELYYNRLHPKSGDCPAVDNRDNSLPALSLISGDSETPSCRCFPTKQESSHGPTRLCRQYQTSSGSGEPEPKS